MSASKSRWNLKVGFITMVLVSALLAEPILSAGKGGRGGGSAGGGSQKSQQSRTPPSAPRVQPSPSVSTGSSKVTVPAPSARPEVRSGTSISRGLNNPSTIFRSGNRQPDRIVTGPSPTVVAPAPQPGPLTSSPQPSNTGGSRSVTREYKTTVGSSPSAGGAPGDSKSSQGSVSSKSFSGANRIEGGPLTVPSGSSISPARTPVIGSSTNKGKQDISASETPSATRERSQIDLDRTHRIGSPIGKERPTAPTIEKQPSTSSSSPVARGGIGRTDSSAGEKKSSAPTAEKQASAGANSRTDSDKTSSSRGPREGRIGSSNSDKKPSVSPTTDQPVISPSKTSRIGSSISGGKDSDYARKKSTFGRLIDLSKPVRTDKTELANSSIGKEKPSVLSTDRQGDVSKSSSRTDSQRTSRTNGSAADKKSSVADMIRDGRRGGHKVDTSEKIQETQDARYKTQDARQGPGQKDRKPAGPRLSRRDSENQTTLINNNIVNNFDGAKTRVRRYERVGSSHVVYDDCVGLVGHAYHHEHMYVDHHERMCHRIIWPEYHYIVRYDWGPWWTFRYVYPYYHRKYIFVSLCGYWPIEYTWVRYYWYGYHPYIWCGYYPIPYEVQGDTYNYYTYNYYTYNYPGTEAGITTTAEPTQTTNYIKPVDHTTFADVREKLARQQAAKPDQETLADTYFEEAVKAFEVNDYNTAIVNFAKASELAPDDMILPFAYAQALLANEQYTEAAGVLRAALAKVTPEKEGVFYPRGLYPGDDILFEQIDRLAEKAELYSFDADLQLLLGYQLLGIGKIDEAVEPLHQASQDLENAPAATVLLNLLEKIRANPDVSGQNTD